MAFCNLKQAWIHTISHSNKVVILKWQSSKLLGLGIYFNVFPIQNNNKKDQDEKENTLHFLLKHIWLFVVLLKLLENQGVSG